MRTGQSLALVTLNASFVMALFASPTPGQVQPARQPRMLSVLANGANTPEKVPDHLAYAHFIIAIAEPDSPSTEQTARRAAMLAPVQLSKSDTTSLIAALKGVHMQLDFLSRETQRLSAERAASQSRLDHLRLQRTRVLDGARTRLAAMLSREGCGRLDAYIRTHVKRNIVMYGDPPQ